MSRTLSIIAATALMLTVGASNALAQQPGATSADMARDQNLRAYVELMRSDIRTQAVAIITEVMQFTDEEDVKFWPIYREFENEIAKINDDRMKLIVDYAEKYQNLSDADADRLAKGALELESRRQTVKAQYYEKFSAALSPKTAARFLQVENQILLLLDLQIAASLPVVE